MMSDLLCREDCEKSTKSDRLAMMELPQGIGGERDREKKGKDNAKR